MRWDGDKGYAKVEQDMRQILRSECEDSELEEESWRAGYCANFYIWSLGLIEVRADKKVKRQEPSCF